jgi:hypothetical protein
MAQMIDGTHVIKSAIGMACFLSRKTNGIRETHALAFPTPLHTKVCSACEAKQQNAWLKARMPVPRIV